MSLAGLNIARLHRRARQTAVSAQRRPPCRAGHREAQTDTPFFRMYSYQLAPKVERERIIYLDSVVVYAEPEAVSERGSRTAAVVCDASVSSETSPIFAHR